MTIKKTTTLLLSVIVALGAVLYLPTMAFACSCVAGISQEKSFKNSEAVFTGTVTSVGLEKNPISETLGFTPSYKRVKIDVEKAWKGIEDSVVTVATAQHGAACGYDFEVGTEYLVYSYSGERRFDTDLSVGLCGRTAVFASDRAQSDIKILGDGKTLDTSRGDGSTSTTTLEESRKNQGMLFEVIKTLDAELQKFLHWFMGIFT